MVNLPQKNDSRQFKMAINKLIDEDDLQIMQLIFDSPSRCSSIGHIAKNVGVSYGTARRRIIKLFDKSIVEECKEKNKRPQFYGLTEMGSTFIEKLKNNKKS